MSHSRHVTQQIESLDRDDKHDQDRARTIPLLRKVLDDFDIEIEYLDDKDNRWADIFQLLEEES